MSASGDLLWFARGDRPAEIILLSDFKTLNRLPYRVPRLWFYPPDGGLLGFEIVEVSLDPRYTTHARHADV